MNPIDNLVSEAMHKLFSGKPKQENQVHAILEDLAYKCMMQGVANVGAGMQEVIKRELDRCVEDEV